MRLWNQAMMMFILRTNCFKDENIVKSGNDPVIWFKPKHKTSNESFAHPDKFLIRSTSFPLILLVNKSNSRKLHISLKNFGIPPLSWLRSRTRLSREVKDLEWLKLGRDDKLIGGRAQFDKIKLFNLGRRVTTSSQSLETLRFV